MRRAQSVTIKLDKTAPTITSSASTSDGPYTAGNWTNKNVTVTFTCADALSGTSSALTGGVVSTETSTGSVTSSGTCVDNAGNAASPDRNDKARQDGPDNHVQREHQRRPLHGGELDEQERDRDVHLRGCLVRDEQRAHRWSGIGGDVDGFRDQQWDVRG